MNICIDCGNDYLYDSSNPLGSSSVRCCSCRQKDSKLNKKIRLYEIAGNHCIKCGYRESLSALSLINAIDPLSKPRTQEQLEKQAKQQFVLCLNCEAEVNSNHFEMKVVSTNPIRVEFYLREVRVVLSKLEQMVTEKSNVEIVHEAPENARRVSGVSQGIGNQSA